MIIPTPPTTHFSPFVQACKDFVQKIFPSAIALYEPETPTAPPFHHIYTDHPDTIGKPIAATIQSQGNAWVLAAWRILKDFDIHHTAATNSYSAVVTLVRSMFPRAELFDLQPDATGYLIYSKERPLFISRGNTPFQTWIEAALECIRHVAPIAEA